jgi:hypothetical protein
MTTYQLQSKHWIQSAYEVSKIFQISEKELGEKFAERFGEDDEERYSMQAIDAAHPTKDAVELALERETRDVLVWREKGGIRAIFVEQDKVDWI